MTRSIGRFRLGQGRRIVRRDIERLLALDLLFRLFVMLRMDRPTGILAVIQILALNDRGDLAALGALQLVNDRCNGGLIEIGQIQVNVVQRLVHKDMGLQRRSDHAAKELRNIGGVLGPTEGHHGFGAGTIPAGG